MEPEELFNILKEAGHFKNCEGSWEKKQIKELYLESYQKGYKEGYDEGVYDAETAMWNNL